MRKFNVSVNGKSYFVEVEELASSASAPAVSAQAVSAPAVQAAAPVVQSAPAAQTAAPAAQVAPAAKPDTTGGIVVKAPMPGTVLKYSVAEGASVKKGQPILVLEAMKMENDISATADGAVTFVAKSGDSVNTGDDLAVIK